MQYNYVLSNIVKPVFSTPETFSHWFGYYNITPMDLSSNKLLAHRVTFDGRAITTDDVAEIGWFDLKDGSWHSLGKTNAFNWQQGSMLQWLQTGKNDEIIFNDVENGQFVARIVSIDGIEKKKIPWPVYGVTPDGKTSISLEFERSYWCRAYHYESIKDPKWDVRIAEEDGLFQVNLETGAVKRIISIQTILQYDYDPVFETSKHWLEHVMINPSGNRFVFYHRFSEGDSFRTRIFTANINGSDIYLLPDWRDSKWSHLGWKDDKGFVVFGIKRLLAGKTYETLSKKSGVFGHILRKIYRILVSPYVGQRTHHKIAASSQYQIYHDKNVLLGGYSKGMLINDGHPSFTEDGRYMLTDTYADDQGYRFLLLYDTKRDKLLELGKFYSPFNNCDYRSDLHPRFSPDYNFVVIDSAHSGKHQMIVLRLDWGLIKN